MATKFWTNQTVNLQSLIAAPVAITGISKANPGEVSTAGALPANNAYVVLLVDGMQQVNRRVFKVSGSGSGKFSIGVDTTGFGTFTSGSFRVITFGHAFNSIRDPQFSGGDPVFEDTTHIHDTEDTQAVISSSPQSFTCTCDWEPGNPALVAANQAFITRTPLAWRWLDPDGTEYLFYATVSATLAPTQSGRKKVTPVAAALQASGTAY